MATRVASEPPGSSQIDFRQLWYLALRLSEPAARRGELLGVETGSKAVRKRGDAVSPLGQPAFISLSLLCTVACTM